MRCMATVTVVTPSLTAAAVLIVMACLAAVGIHHVTGDSNAGVITREIGFYLSHRVSRMGTMTGVALDHGVGH